MLFQQTYMYMVSAQTHSPEDGSEMLAENLGTFFLFSFKGVYCYIKGVYLF